MIVVPSTPEQNGSSAPPASPASVEPVATPDVQAPRKREPIMLHMPVSVRNVSLVVLAVFASLFVLQSAKAVLDRKSVV